MAVWSNRLAGPVDGVEVMKNYYVMNSVGDGGDVPLAWRQVFGRKFTKDDMELMHSDLLSVRGTYF